jgi:hypothetical protein
MNRTVRPLHPPQAEIATRDSRVSLRLVNGDSLTEWTDTPWRGSAKPHCLLYLVALQRPQIRSNLVRRLRLWDSLAGGNASHNASILARDPHFWDYLQQINLMAYDAEIGSRRARQFINRVCGVNGRYDLARCPDAALRFFTLVEEPFLDWLLATDCD